MWRLCWLASTITGPKRSPRGHIPKFMTTCVIAVSLRPDMRRLCTCVPLYHALDSCDCVLTQHVSVSRSSRVLGTSFFLSRDCRFDSRSLCRQPLDLFFFFF